MIQFTPGNLQRDASGVVGGISEKLFSRHVFNAFFRGLSIGTRSQIFPVNASFSLKSGGIVGYSVASGELKSIGNAVKTDGITDAGIVQIGDQELHNVSYNDLMAGCLSNGERVALLLSPTRYVIALRRRDGEIVYSSEENEALMEEGAPVAYYVLMGLVGALTVLVGIGVVVLFLMYRTYLKRQDLGKALAKFKSVSL